MRRELGWNKYFMTLQWVTSNLKEKENKKTAKGQIEISDREWKYTQLL